MAAAEDADTIVSEEVKSPWLLTGVGNGWSHVERLDLFFLFSVVTDLQDVSEVTELRHHLW
jgi:hypothetical protein